MIVAITCPIMTATSGWSRLVYLYIGFFREFKFLVRDRGFDICISSRLVGKGSLDRVKSDFIFKRLENESLCG